MKGRRMWTLEPVAEMVFGTQLLLESPPWQQGRNRGKRENEEERKKITPWASWELGQKLFQEQIRDVTVTVTVPILSFSPCSNTATHPQLWGSQPSLGLPCARSYKCLTKRFLVLLFICCSENWDTFQACFTVPTMTNFMLTSGRLRFVQFCFTQTTCLKSCQNASITYHYLPCRKYQGTQGSQHLNIQ